MLKLFIEQLAEGEHILEPVAEILTEQLKSSLRDELAMPDEKKTTTLSFKHNYSMNGKSFFG